MIWLVFGALTLGALAIVAMPLFRRGEANAEAGDISVYRDQLTEIDRDLERGVISEAEAEAARVEIKRRILAVPARQRMVDMRLPRGAIATAGIGVVGFCVMLYLALGQPELPGHPYDPRAVTAAREREEKALVSQVEAMIAALEARVKANPHDLNSWRVLGWTYLQIGRVKQGVDALGHATALDPKDADLKSQYGEALVRAAEGKVTAEARKQFDAALARDPKDARARFYRGLELAQAGKEREALALWAQIIRDGPGNAPWMASVRAQASELAVKLKLDPKTVLP